jgi:RNA polymerase sigma factor (sigma-70 family)
VFHVDLTTPWTTLLKARETRDREALEKLVKFYWAPLVSYFLRHTRNEADAEDLAQEAAGRVFDPAFLRHYAVSREKGPFHRFLLKCAYHQLRNFRRARGAALRRERGGAVSSPLMAATGLTPDQQYEVDCAWALWWDVRRRFAEHGDPLTVQILQLHYDQGHSYQAIGQRLGLTEAAVNSRASRARGELLDLVRQQLRSVLHEASELPGELDALRKALEMGGPSESGKRRARQDRP